MHRRRRRVVAVGAEGAGIRGAVEEQRIGLGLAGDDDEVADGEAVAELADGAGAVALQQAVPAAERGADGAIRLGRGEGAERRAAFQRLHLVVQRTRGHRDGGGAIRLHAVDAAPAGLRAGRGGQDKEKRQQQQG